MERIRSYDTQSLFQAASSFRRDAMNARTTAMRLRNKTDALTTQRLGEATELIAGMRQHHSEWINSKLSPLSPYLQKAGSSPEEANRIVQEEYDKGLKGAIIMRSTITGDHSDLQDTVTAYTSGFVRMVRMGKSMKMSPRVALKLAQQNYWVNASDYKNLMAQFSDLPQHLITHAVTTKSRNSREFLTESREKIHRFSDDPRYSHLDKRIVHNAVLKRSNPGVFLDKFMEAVARLSDDNRYKTLPPYMIEHAALNYHNNPEEFLDACNRTAERLSHIQRFQSLSPGMFQRAAFQHSRDPEGYLDSYMRTRSNNPPQRKVQPRSTTTESVKRKDSNDIKLKTADEGTHREEQNPDEKLAVKVNEMLERQRADGSIDPGVYFCGRLPGGSIVLILHGNPLKPQYRGTSIYFGSDEKNLTRYDKEFELMAVLYEYGTVDASAYIEVSKDERPISVHITFPGGHEGNVRKNREATGIAGPYASVGGPHAETIFGTDVSDISRNVMPLTPVDTVSQYYQYPMLPRPGEDSPELT